MNVATIVQFVYLYMRINSEVTVDVIALVQASFTLSSSTITF